MVQADGPSRDFLDDDDLRCLLATDRPLPPTARERAPAGAQVMRDS
jgi:hypothetical protein